MYQQVKYVDGSINPNVIKRVADCAFIPNDSNNHDWLEYQEWLAQGNVPLPA